MTTPVHSTLPETGFLRISQILRFLPIGRSTFWKWVKEGKAPPAIKLGPKTTVWKAEVIRPFIDLLSQSNVDDGGVE